MPSTIHATAIAALAAGLALSCPSAQALNGRINSVGTAASSCQSALPAFEGYIRKRPLGVQNEGTGDAFVTCATTNENWLVEATIAFSSIDGLPHNVSCTGVIGILNYATYAVKSRSVYAGGTMTYIVFEPSDFGRTEDFGTREFSASCRLVPGVGINYLSMEWYQYIGA